MARGELIHGLHTVMAALHHQPDRIQVLWVEHNRRDARLRALLDKAQQLAITIRFGDRKSLDNLASDPHHQGVVARLSQKVAALDEQDLAQVLAAHDGPPLLLALDGVQDPHNLGACLRCADAAGVQAVIAPADRAVGLNATVCKVACGAAETVAFVQVTNLARSLRTLQEYGLWIIGAAGKAEKILYEVDFTGPMVIVLGSEGKGLRRLTREVCDGLARIPMAGQVESLNVSVAAGIFLFEALRQRRHGLRSGESASNRR